MLEITSLQSLAVWCIALLFVYGIWTLVRDDAVQGLVYLLLLFAVGLALLASRYLT